MYEEKIERLEISQGWKNTYFDSLSFEHPLKKHSAHY